MRGVDGDTKAPELVLVDFITAAFRQRLDETRDRNSGLKSVVAGDQADVSSADDEQAFGRADQVTVDESLERARAINAGKRTPRESQGLFPRSRGHEKDFGPDLDIAVSVFENAHFFIAEHGQGGALEPNLDAGISPELVLELGGDVDAAGSGEHRVVGSEKPVGLEDELSTETVFVVDQESRDTEFPHLDRRRETGRAAADDQHRNGDFLDGREAGRIGNRREDGKTVHGGESLARTDEFHAGFHRKAVGQDETLGALAVGAKNSLRGMILMMIAENAFPVSEKSGGDGFPRSGREETAFPGDGDALNGGGRQDGMLIDAKISHIFLFYFPIGTNSKSDMSEKLYHISNF